MKATKLLLVSALLGLTSLSTQPARATIVYQNTNTTDTLQFDPLGFEVGDEITLAGTERLLTTFAFEYWTANLDGDETLTFTLYRNDGPLANGFATPGSILFTDTFTLTSEFWTQKGRATYDLTANNIVVPTTFTWAVQFGNLTDDDAAGLGLSNAGSTPDIGNSLTDYWDNGLGGWTLRTNVNPSILMNFAAEVSAVPEPTTMAFGAMGALALLAFRLRRAR